MKNGLMKFFFTTLIISIYYTFSLFLYLVYIQRFITTPI